MTTPLPKLLILNRLVEPLSAAGDILERLAVDLESEHAPTLLHGALVMAVAAVEVALADSLKYYLGKFPEKLPKNQLTMSPDLMLFDMADLLTFAAQRYVTSLAYKAFPGFVEQYGRVLSVEFAGAISAEIEAIQEIKATRNLLLHNGPVANDFYLEQAGSRRRANQIGHKVKVDGAYVLDSVSTLSKFVPDVMAAVEAKYAGYTKIMAHRRLWSYLVDSPVMRFDEFWDVDEAGDRIFAKRSHYESQLSSTELILLGIWRAHFSGDGQYLTKFNVHQFDSSTLRKFNYLLSVARDFPWT